MHERASDQGDVFRFPRSVTDLIAYENVTSMIDLLQENLARARGQAAVDCCCLGLGRRSRNRHPLVVYPWGQRKSHRQADGADP